MRYWYVALKGAAQISWRVRACVGDFDLMDTMKDHPDKVITFFTEITEAQAKDVQKMQEAQEAQEMQEAQEIEITNLARSKFRFP